MATQKIPNTIKIKYKKSQQYHVLPCDGARSVNTPGGLISIDFFSERFEVSETSAYKVDIKTGSLVEENEEEGYAKAFIREYIVGLSMNPIVARNVGKLLIDKAEQAISAQSSAMERLAKSNV